MRAAFATLPGAEEKFCERKAQKVTQKSQERYKSAKKGFFSESGLWRVFFLTSSKTLYVRTSGLIRNTKGHSFKGLYLEAHGLDDEAMMHDISSEDAEEEEEEEEEEVKA